MQTTVFLVKANDRLISHCRCQCPPIGAPAQMDCPWCGCGWLFVCPICRKAFTFARAEKVKLSWEQLAHRDLDGKWGRDPSPEEVVEWIDFMKILTKDVELGREYAYIDGWVFPVDERDLWFEGWHARHELERIPQVVALEDRTYLERTLGSQEYWRSRRLQEQ